VTVPARQDLLTSADELAAAIEDPQLRVIDCRFDLMAPDAGRTAWLEAHIPGAVYADLDADLSGPITHDTGRHPLPSISDAAETFSRLGVDERTRVVAYDDAGGAIASRAWWLLRWLGHRRVTVLDGGLPAWRARDLPLEAGLRKTAPREFRATVEPARVLSTQEIAADPHSVRVGVLIDARDAVRYRGEAEPIDPVAGHIPGAKNLPLGACLREDGAWQDATALRAKLAPLLGDDDNAQWAVMCGSGVTACHLAISGLLAGYREPRLYVGSWSEWIRDPRRPIAVAGRL
jgi:thiosulfate/3-mercaptopyruvate sulfurtransferase